MSKEPLILIIGGGFGGAYCAQALGKRLGCRAAQVHLIDRRNYFVFYPLLVEAGTGSLEPRHTVVSLRSFLKRGRFTMAEVNDIDLETHTVSYGVASTGVTQRLTYDYLVLSPGSVTYLPDVEGIGEYGFQMKSLTDAVALRDHAIEMLELADALDDAEARRALLRFVVVGGNFTGVEVAGEFHTFLRTAAKHYRSVSPREATVTLVELSDRILAPLGDDLSNYARRKMTAFGIDVRVEDTVARIEADAVLLRSGERISTRTVVWCAGTAPPPLLAKIDSPKDKRGYLIAERDLRLPNHPNVWAIGDCAVNCGPDGKPYPPTAQHAVRQARHAAADIIRALDGKASRPCDITPLGSVAAIGCRTGVAKIMGIKVSGFVAWWLYRTVYLMKMPGLARKMRLLADWTLALLFPREFVQLSVHQRPHEHHEASDARSTLDA